MEYKINCLHLIYSSNLWECLMENAEFWCSTWLKCCRDDGIIHFACFFIYTELHTPFCWTINLIIHSTWIEMVRAVFASVVVVWYFAVFFMQWKQAILSLKKAKLEKDIFWPLFLAVLNLKATLFTIYVCVCVYWSFFWWQWQSS